ncbi:MAG: undecaprenyl-phosphate glucose phosphotransferase [Gammaproteobacteria bacterium]|nr:undecaprenyl-phosphate glucose phosphotransferase [Gammaproteobacteria bacterium]MBU1416658.1 undecaprenyl-phosphate glucose phosphotransferase [Gammaproteobacteria bacterium]
MVESLLDPLVLVLSLWSVGIYVEGELTPPFLILSLLVFSLTFPGPARLQLSPWRAAKEIILSWLAIAALLLFFGYASRYLGIFDIRAKKIWLWLAPLCQLVAHFAFRRSLPILQALQGEQQRVIIAGMNAQGIALAERIQESRYSSARLDGFFDDRVGKRIPTQSKFPVLGTLNDLPQYTKDHHVDGIYISLPMATQPRTLSLLDQLRDTTASIYFVPDTFVTDLIQARMDTVGGIPVVAVCETPFAGANGVLKRASDIFLSSLILVLLLPVLLVIGIAVRLDSPGPVIFRQRRYGLGGEEIIVYKFRSMTVCEDGGNIQQAKQNDQRITRLGAFLRKTSLDELPQFINVLQGRMSIVGPRPHAIAHNEMYRKLISGYMVRHKVKPGITGWAQVNGLRGETETVDKMKQRIDYDLEYLRNWSLRLDLDIILRTILVVLKDDNAY